MTAKNQQIDDSTEWRVIPGYDNMYEINYFGDVRSWRWRGSIRARSPRLLKPFTVKGRSRRKVFVKLIDSNGNGKRIPVISLMANVWLGGLPEGKVRVHKDGAMSNNCANNIEFVTINEAARLSGGCNRRTVVKVDRDGNVVAFYPSIRAAAKANYTSERAVRDRCKGTVTDPYRLDDHTYRYDDI